MTFFQNGIVAPEVFATDKFYLCPLRGSDAILDYDAVMESRTFLRLWSLSTWPEDDFTLERNRQDLERHEREHINNEAFTYTVMNSDKTRCLGCVYIFPMDWKTYQKSEIVAVRGEEWARFEAAIHFWIRKSELPRGLDHDLLMALRTWFGETWLFKKFLFVTNEQCQQQVSMFQNAGLQLQFRIIDPEKSGRGRAYTANC